jgi:serine/threonine protein kinase
MANINARTRTRPEQVLYSGQQGLNLEGKLVFDEVDQQKFRLSFLGSGICGQVYKAVSQEPGSGLVYAFKFPNGPKWLPFIERAAKLLQNLEKHPNVVEYKGRGVSAELRMPYLKFEYLEGKNLDAFIADTQPRGRIDADRSLSIVLDIMRAIQKFHEKGIIHADLKPSNIMVLRESKGRDVVKILDFEFVRASDGVKAYFSALDSYDYGTGAMPPSKQGPLNISEYIAPEVRNQGIVKEAADIFSIARLMQLCLTGLRHIDSDAEMIQGKLKEIGYGYLEDIITKGSRADPALRFSSVRQMSELIEARVIGKRVEGDKDKGEFQREYIGARDFIGKPSEPGLKGGLYRGQSFLSARGVEEIGLRHKAFTDYVERKIQQEPIEAVRKSMLQKKEEIDAQVLTWLNRDLNSLVNLLVTAQLKRNSELLRDVKSIVSAWKQYPVASIADFVKNEKVNVSDTVRRSEGNIPDSFVKDENDEYVLTMCE